MAPRRVDKDARRQEILAAAVRVFARKGFAATRIDDVAAEAGIAKGSVYLYFDSRDAILSAAFEAHAARAAGVLAAVDAKMDAKMDAEANANTDAEVDPLDRLAALIRATVAMLAADADLARVQLDLWSTSTPPEIEDIADIAGVYRDYRTAIAALLRAAELRPGLDPDHTAAVIVGAVEGCLVQWLVDPAIPLVDLADPIVRVCVEGLR